jgi:hypothetical protein
MQASQMARRELPQEIEEYEGGMDAEKPRLSQVGANDVVNKSAFGSPVKSKVHEANIWQLCIFTFVIGLGNIQTGFAISGNNQTAPVIKAKFGWDREEATLYNTLISSAAIFGVVSGSLVGGRFI